MATRGRLVAGNWKMHGNRAANDALLAAVAAGAAGLPGVEVVVCPPFPYLQQAKDALSGSSVAWGAQNLSEHVSGAHTGEVSASMLVEFGCKAVIVGHSERRALHAESDAQVAAKFAAARAAGLLPVLCVGESLAEREAGRTEEVVGRQLDAVLDGSGAASLSQAVLAYEPVWAIGTGRNATPEQAQEVHAFLRARVASRVGASAGASASELRILYGGSVKAANAAAIFAMPDVDGGLIGGASLVADDFLAICRAAERRG